MLPHERASIDERTAALPVNPPVLPLAMPHLSRPLAVLRDHSRYVPGRFQVFPLSMPACTMRGSHIVGRCACTWPPPERDFSSSCSCGLFFNAVSTGAGERSRQNARACTENASNVFWRERGRRGVEPGAASSVAMVESYESSLRPCVVPICATA